MSGPEKEKSTGIKIANAIGSALGVGWALEDVSD